MVFCRSFQVKKLEKNKYPDYLLYVKRTFVYIFICLGVFVFINQRNFIETKNAVQGFQNLESDLLAGREQSSLMSWIKPSLYFYSPKENFSVPPTYPSLEELQNGFADLVQKYPHIAVIETLGVSTAQQQPILGICISDQPQEQEDEPAILFSALHHAREPAGIFICKAIMAELLNNYGLNERHTNLVNSLEIWFVPIVNPDGYQYIMESQRQFPWWRKNLRDNNADGEFDPLVDGVDLNRNYGYNWQEDSDSNDVSWFYRGRKPFSENEVQALRDLALARNFMIGISYHSYGEDVLYPWGNYNPAPDHELILEIAQNCASQISRLQAERTYDVLSLDGRIGQSSVWMYAELGTMDFIIEAGDQYFPSESDLTKITTQNVRGAFYLMERALCSGISGHVIDAQTGVPLVADILVHGFDCSYTKPRHSYGRFGRFDRLLIPGQYVVEIVKQGYVSFQSENIEVYSDRITSLEVELERESLKKMGNLK